MRSGQLVLVKSKIRSGAFSGERVFELSMTGRPDPYIGIAPVDHCRGTDQKPVGRNEPGHGSEINGFVEAYLITNGGNEARVELPDGEAIKVSTDQLMVPPEPDRGARYVPIGS